MFNLFSSCNKAHITFVMAQNSPNNSTLTISPLVTRRSRDYFKTPPPLGNRRRIFSGSHRIFSSPNSQHIVNGSSLQKAKGSYSATSDNLDVEGAIKHATAIANDSDQVKQDELSSFVKDHDSTDHEDIPLTQADKLRLWRHDALLQHHYATAVYIGDKVLTMTNDPNDAFWLAQVYYSKGDYQMARNLLSGSQFEESVSCRYLSGLCLLKLEKYDEALDVVGESNPFKKDHHVKNTDGGIKLEASLCYLRGVIYARQNNFEKAKESYKEAVEVDVKCFEAFHELISNSMLTPDEELNLVSHLDFEDADNNADLVKLLYTTLLSKYGNVHKFENAEQRLKDEYNLEENVDLMLARTDLLYVQCRFQDCLELCRKILSKGDLNLQVFPNYLSCLYETGGKNELFLAAHKLAENYPNSYITWLAIGTYYFSIGKVNEARQFFSRASILNPSFGPAWIGFAHTFAIEGEHEQAISAYATASRLFPGSHLPTLFLGMQYLQMKNITLAQEYLNLSLGICSLDPLLLNELGVLYYNEGDLNKAEVFLQKALLSSQNLDSGAKAWCSIHCNLGHVYRREKRYRLAITHFNEVLHMSKGESDVYSSMGLIYLKLGHVAHSIGLLHSALAINSTDAIATELLNKALEINLKLRNSKFIDENTGSVLENKTKEQYVKRRPSNFSTPKDSKNDSQFIRESIDSNISFVASDPSGVDNDNDNGDDVMELDTD